MNIHTQPEIYSCTYIYFPPNELKTRNDKTLWAHWCPKKWSTGMHHQPAIDLATTSFFQGFNQTEMAIQPVSAGGNQYLQNKKGGIQKHFEAITTFIWLIKPCK